MFVSFFLLLVSKLIYHFIYFILNYFSWLTYETEFRSLLQFSRPTALFRLWLIFFQKFAQQNLKNTTLKPLKKTLNSKN